ncbi:helix-turn-helix domain-containing protein [Micromonospora sp. NPDC023966]|uniref:winged helix-turn-helix transcriptional regulator n=1 Tax=Micromonospora sp. NPDC023966 TaxID=3154699 RepID=UPI0034074171
MAAKRLKQLVADGLLQRRPYQDPGKRTRYEYVLTELGRELFPVLVALIQWGERLGREGGVELVHVGCGSPLGVVVECAKGHEVALPDTAAWLVRDGNGTDHP